MKKPIALIICLSLLLLVGCAVQPATAPVTSEEPTTAGESTTTVTTSATETTAATVATAATTAATAATTAPKKVPTADEIYASLSAADRDCKTFQLDKYMQNLWKGNVIYNESATPHRDQSGAPVAIRLMYPVDRVLAVHNATFTKTYVEGKDYAIKDGCLVPLEGGAMAMLTYDELYPTTDTSIKSLYEGRWLQYKEGAWFHQHQIAVSYIHTSVWEDTATMPGYWGNLLPRTLQMLQSKQPLNIVLTGDSIGGGGNPSKGVGMAPYCPSWGELVELYWENYFGSDIALTNLSVGGATFTTALDLLDQTTAAKPDLIIISYGMNDSTHRVSEVSYYSQYQRFIEKVRAVCPDCEFILISSMASNPEEEYDRDMLLHDYHESLLDLTALGGVAVADVTTTHEGVLTRKFYTDMTGNNVNHPNDFLGRIYAQTIGFMLTDEGVL